MGKWDSLVSGYGLGRQMVNDYQDAKKKKEIADIVAAQQDQQSALTETNAPAAQQMTYDSDTGQYVPSLQSVVANRGTTAPEAAPQLPTFDAKNTTSFLGKSYDQPLNEAGMTGARQQAMAGVMEKYGDPEGAMRYRQQAKQGDATDLLLTQAKKKGLREDQADVDNAALRKALMGGIPTATAGVPASQPTQGPSVQDQLAAGAGMGEARTMASTGTIGAGQPLTPKNIATQQNDLQGYLTNAAPEVMKTLLSQGKLTEAKNYSDFVSSESGKSYATAWVTGLRKHAMGDHRGAISAFERLYNSQMYNDGQTVKIDPIGNGEQYRVQMFGADGKSIGEQTLDPATLARQAALMLNPTEAVKFHAEQQGKREAEAATLDRQVQLEVLKQETAGMHEDRRDNRLVTRLNAAPARGGLTLTQQKSNLEIDAARDQVATLAPAEIRRRTAKQTDTGRENPDYDGTLARASNLAGRRKVGEDSVFDNRQGGSTQQAPAVDRQEVAKRFRSDGKMNNYRLGNATPRGTEVLDKSGKVIGHYK